MLCSAVRKWTALALGLLLVGALAAWHLIDRSTLAPELEEQLIGRGRIAVLGFELADLPTIEGSAFELPPPTLAEALLAGGVDVDDLTSHPISLAPAFASGLALSEGQTRSR